MAIPTPDQRIAQPTHDTQISGDRAPGGVCTRPSGSFQHPLARKSENTADKLCRQIYALFDSRSHQSSVYQFDADGRTYTLRVGEQNAAIATLFKNHDVSGATFITAHNPASLQLGSVHNELADRALRQDLRGLAKVVFPGEGGDPGGLWPPEQSLLAAGIDRSEAEMLARRYGQYAVLWVDAEGHVSLVELTDLDKASRYPLKVPPFGWVELGVNWGYEWATLRLTPSQWLHILQGGDFGKTSRSRYDGKAFTLSWGFSGGTHLEVSYGDGGCAYNGELAGVSLTLVARK